MKDKDIVDLYWKRDENAIKLTQEKYEKYLMKIAVNILGDYQESEQSVNDTYLAAWNSMPDNRPDILSVYLGKITRRISISIHRMKNRIKRGGSEFDLSYEELSDCMADKNSPGDELEAKELEREIVSFVRALSETECFMFVSRYYHFDSIKDTRDLSMNIRDDAKPSFNDHVIDFTGKDPAALFEHHAPDITAIRKIRDPMLFAFMCE